MQKSGSYAILKISLYWGKTMAYKINPDACINCGACEGECPTGSISEANDKRVINADSCVSCGACAGACPSEAISEE